MMQAQPKDLVYPLFERASTRCERWAIRFGRWPGFCTVCGRRTIFRPIHANLRESCHCRHCRSNNRQRQMAWIAARSFGIGDRIHPPSLAALAKKKVLSVWNTESSGPIHSQLESGPGYVCSEYFGPEYRSGDRVNGILHQDLQHCSFADERFDLVLSSDVMEHIADPYQAHREIYRILKKGGRHIFTAPFYQTRFQDEVRSQLDEKGNLVHFQDPWYHDDPVRPNQGAVVFRIFSMEMLVRLEEIGFHTRFYRTYAPWYGIFGPNGLVFEAYK